MSNQIIKMFSQQFGKKFTLKAQQGLRTAYGKEIKRFHTSGKNKKKKKR